MAAGTCGPVNGPALSLLGQPTAAAYFGPRHVLAEVAGRLCAAHRSPLSKAVACGPCWELAIATDARFAAEFDLPAELIVDHDYVDEIAVDLACRGERIELTSVELTAAVARLLARQMSTGAVAVRLHRSYEAVVAVLPQPASSAARAKVA